MRILMVTTFPPKHCGIGAYAEQSVNQLRSQGHVVDVVSPDQQGNVDFAWDLRGGSNILKLKELLPYYDKVVIQYHCSFFYRDPADPALRRDTHSTTLAFIRLFAASRKIEVVAHEIPYMSGKGRRLFAWKWKLIPKLVFHTTQERTRLEKHYGIRLRDSQVEFRPHHDVFQKFTDLDRHAARRSLGIAADHKVFLCIGFIQRHKGFHRAIDAFLNAQIPDARLYVVGSLRYVDSETQAYLQELYDLVRGQENVRIVERFTSNEEFDTWITASDWVVVPYSEIWSSGVLARTRLLDRPAIVSAVGGLPDQAGIRDLLFNGEDELVNALRTAADRIPSHSASASSA